MYWQETNCQGSGSVPVLHSCQMPSFRTGMASMLYSSPEPGLKIVKYPVLDLPSTEDLISSFLIDRAVLLSELIVQL